MGSISKSVRLVPDTVKYIDNYRGQGFTNRLENLIEDFRNSEGTRLARIELLDKRITQNEERLRYLSNECLDYIEELERFLRSARRDIADRFPGANGLPFE